jgi:hypothetical protein
MKTKSFQKWKYGTNVQGCINIVNVMFIFLHYNYECFVVQMYKVALIL